MELNITKISWDLFSLLCQGVIGGLVVLFFSEYFQKRRRKRLLEILCDTLLIELECHIVNWERLLNQEPILTEDISVLKNNSVFNKNLELFYEMEIRHSRIILFYFNSAYNTFERLNVRRFSNVDLQIMYLTAIEAQCCLNLYCTHDAQDRAAAFLKLQDAEKKILILQNQRHDNPNPK